MASDYFLKFGDIKGESQDDRHRDQIVALSWSWGVSAPLPNPAGGGGGGRPVFQDLIVTHAYDKSSPLLMKACATQQHVPEATLTARARGQGRQDFLIIKMTDALIASVSAGASRDELMTEMLQLRFSKVTVSYSAQKPDGSLEPPVVFGYDITANRPL